MRNLTKGTADALIDVETNEMVAEIEQVSLRPWGVNKQGSDLR